MHAVIAMFIQAVGWSLVPLGWKLLRGLGFAAFTFVGVQALMDKCKEYVFTNLGSLPVEWLQVLGLLQVDTALNILFSCYVVRAVYWGMNQSGGKTGFRWKGGE